MNKGFIALAVIAAMLVGFPAAVLAGPPEHEQVRTAAVSGPTEMTDAEMDTVTAGALLTVIAFDVVDIENNKVAVQAAVNAAVGVLGNAVALQRSPARITQ
jgi:hypothetical protein